MGLWAEPVGASPASAGYPAASSKGHLMISPENPTLVTRRRYDHPHGWRNRRPSSMATGWISFTEMSVLSPGMTISVPSGNVTTPVTSVVRK